jgi:threonine dehydrogenase-like Zn-dependent dehydrogenase
MRAAVLCDIAQIQVQEVPPPQMGPRDVLVRVGAVGLCGTDFHIFAGHANYNTDEHGRPIPLNKQPQILGHEIVGVIEEVGSKVRDLSAGDRVVIDQGLNCMSANRLPLCEYCASGDSHQCAFYQEHGITGLQGGLAEYLAIPAVNAIRIDSDLDMPEAALTEPLGCIIHSSDMVARARSRYAIGADDSSRRVRSLLICGAGPAGLLFTQYLRNVLGYDGLLIVSEPNAKKRELVASFGAEAVDPSSVDLPEVIREMTDGRCVEYMIEATGVGSVLAATAGLIRKQATVLLYGHGHAGVDLSVLNNVMFLEPTLIASVGASGSFDVDGRPLTYRRALGLLEAGKIKVAPFITHRYRSLEAVPRAFAGEHHNPDYVKGIVVI